MLNLCWIGGLVVYYRVTNSHFTYYRKLFSISLGNAETSTIKGYFVSGIVLLLFSLTLLLSTAAFIDTCTEVFLMIQALLNVIRHE